MVVQLAGSKTWIVYDEMVAAPRPDLKFKPPAASLGKPIGVVELNPGDLMYIPRCGKTKDSAKEAESSNGMGWHGSESRLFQSVVSFTAHTYAHTQWHGVQPGVFGLAVWARCIALQLSWQTQSACTANVCNGVSC